MQKKTAPGRRAARTLAILYLFTVASCGVVSGLDEYDISCASAADCPAPENACQRVVCIKGECTKDVLPEGTPLPETSGDECGDPVCDGAGGIRASYKPAGTPCGLNAGCNGEGLCKCDLSPAGCGNGQVGCLGCAFAGNCRDEDAACANNPDCFDLLTCISTCVTPCTAEDCVYECSDSCVAQFPQGAALYFSRIRCLTCDECPNACAGDAFARQLCSSQ
jgi:hypothetical protein